MNKFESFLFLVTVLGYCPMAEAKTTYFKSEVAGQDLPFSDAALVGNTLYISGKGGVLPGTRTVPEDPKEEARLLMEDFKNTLARVDMTMDDLVYDKNMADFFDQFGTLEEIVITPQDAQISVQGNTVSLLSSTGVNENYAWKEFFEQYGEFQAGTSKLKL